VRGEGVVELRRLLRQASRLAPDWPELSASFALFHLARGQRSRAGAETALFLESHPYNARGWLLHARVLRAAGKDQAAAEAAARSLGLGDADLDSLLEAGEILQQTGAREEARRVRTELLERFPESWRAWRGAAFGLVTEGESEDAVAASTRMVQLQPRLAAAWIGHGMVLSRCGRLLEAAFALERGRALLPRGDAFLLAARAALELADTWRRQGERERAVECLLWTVEATSGLLASNPVAGLALRGQALLEMGEDWGGFRALRAARELQPFEPLRSRIRQIMARIREEALE
jgi:tetratricopeptide (TPR) repeat protein